MVAQQVRGGAKRKSVRRVEAMKAGEVHFTNRSEGRKFFNARARALLRISGPTFLARLDAGKYEDVDSVTAAKAQHLKMLISFARPGGD